MPTTQTEPPIIEVRNPVIYLRRFWEKVIGNEGMELKITIKPLTTILGIALLGTIYLGVGEFVIPEGYKIPFVEFSGFQTSKPTQSPMVNSWKETGFTGKLQLSLTTGKYFLITTSSEAITLDVPNNLDLVTLVGKRIFAIGEYNKNERLLKVFDVKDLEVLPKTPVPIPTLEPTPIATIEAETNSSTIPLPTDIINIVTE